MPIEGRSTRDRGRADPARHGRRRRGRLHRRRASPRRAHGRPLRAGRRRAVVRRRSRRSAPAQALGLAPDRIYGDFEEMAKAEAKRPDGIEAVAIVTPNHMHAPAAKAFLKAGIHVICDKPLTHDAQGGAGRWQKPAKQSGRIFALTHNYTGYPMVRQARAMVAAGELGEIRVVQVGVSAGLADRADRGRPARSRRPGAPIPSAPAPAAASAISARTPTISRASSPAWSWTR